MGRRYSPRDIGLTVKVTPWLSFNSINKHECYIETLTSGIWIELTASKT